MLSIYLPPSLCASLTCDAPARRKSQFDLAAFFIIDPHQPQVLL